MKWFRVSSEADNQPRNSPLIKIGFWLLFFSIGITAYYQSFPARYEKKSTLMERQFFGPEWHAGKLGEAFANQDMRNGACRFYAFSKLLFKEPADFNAWSEIHLSVTLPETSYLVVLLEKKDSDSSFGFRISRNQDYPSGHIEFLQNRLEKYNWQPTTRPIPEVVEVEVHRTGKSMKLFYDGQLLDECEDTRFPELHKIAVLAGPTGLTLKQITIMGTATSGAPVLIQDDFSPLTQKPFFVTLWLRNLLIGGLVAVVLYLMLLITERQLPFSKPSLLLMIICSWFLWGIGQATTSHIVFFGLILLQLFILLYGLRQILKTETGALTTVSDRNNTKLTFYVRLAIALLTIAGCCLIIWRSEYAVSSAQAVPPFQKSFTERQQILLGNSLILAENGVNFEWDSKVNLRKGTIAEWVFRKYTGSDNNRSEWYAVTLSRREQHPSGLYFTRQNYQVLLQAFELPAEHLPKVHVHLRVVNKRFEISLNNKIVAVVTHKALSSGQIALVPINKGITVLESHIKSLETLEPVLQNLKTSSPSFIFWSFLLLLCFFRWEKKSARLSPFKKTLGMVLFLAPFWVALGKSYQHPTAWMNQFVIGVAISFILLFTLSLLVQSERKFFRMSEVLILLICFEFFLRINPHDSRLQENPIQVNIPKKLYWYRAASARRWNSLINHQMFRNRTFGAPFSKDLPSSKVRILCLGSSSTASGYPQYLADSFHDAGYDTVEVLDSGIPGTTTTHLLNLYKNLLTRFKPDIVTLCLIRNDMKFLAILEAQQTFQLETSHKGISTLQSRMYHILNKMMLYRLYRYYILSSLRGAEFAQHVSTLVNQDKDEALQRAIKVHIANLKAFVTTARKHGQIPIFIIEPFFVSDGYDTLPAARNDETVEAVYELARKHKVPIINMQKTVQNNRHDLIFIDDVHHNQTGKKFLGQAIFEQLKRHVQPIVKKKNESLKQ
ncbi:SGNH/GDSL hydrolase family protein [candidate division CSSED10-310 bacterium]|uniref:SGNH/GDSL hydrolase family protein n=1 Tax=candidate division CSSED10-310 bacterium TaxID=2855610 RepID=A0ABV6Z5V6_UNCC1